MFEFYSKLCCLWFNYLFFSEPWSWTSVTVWRKSELNISLWFLYLIACGSLFYNCCSHVICSAWLVIGVSYICKDWVLLYELWVHWYLLGLLSQCYQLLWTFQLGMWLVGNICIHYMLLCQSVVKCWIDPFKLHGRVSFGLIVSSF